MIITNRTLSIIDTAFTIIDRIERVDYVALGETVINIIATTAAIIVGVASYIITALQLFWEDHGQSIIINTVRFIINFADYCHELYQLGAETKRFITKSTNFLADRAFYTIAALN